MWQASTPGSSAVVEGQELHTGATVGDISRDVLVRDEVINSATAAVNNRVNFFTYFVLIFITIVFCFVNEFATFC